MNILQTFETYDFGPSGLECYYHTASPVNAIDTLTYQRLFPSLPSKVNDPEDMKINFKGTITKWNDVSVIADNMSAAAKQGVRAKFKSKKCFDSRLGFVCMAYADAEDRSKRVAKTLWTRYADCYKGVRIKFCIDRDFIECTNANVIWCGPIVYGERKVVVDLDIIDSSASIDRLLYKDFVIKRFCFRKLNEWRVEHEFRFGTMLKHLPSEYSDITHKKTRFFKFRRENVCEIAVGHACNQYSVSALKKIASDWGVSFREVRP